MEKVKTIIITQARVGSTRLPGKIFKEIGNKSLLELHLERLKQVNSAEKVVLATTFEDGVEEIIKIAHKVNVIVHQGSTDDVLDRFYQTAKPYHPQYIVRVTSDCPLLDPVLIDQVIEMTRSCNLDYGANILKENFPDGQDVEVFTYEALEKAWTEANLKSEREHVTPFIRKNCDFNGGSLFKADNFSAQENYNHIRMTVDEQSDLDAIETLIGKLGSNQPWIEYANYIVKHPERFNNQKTIRNEGYLKSLKEDF